MEERGKVIMNVLVAGAYGHPGRCLFEYLSKYSDYNVKKEVRTQPYLKGDQIVAGSQREDILYNSMREMDAVISADGGGVQTNKQKINSSIFKKTRTLIDTATRCRVDRFILLSSMGADDPQGAAEHYLYKKREAEDYLKNSGLAYTIVRPGHLVHGEPSGKISVKENMEWVGNPDISCGDIAQMLASVLASGRLINKTVEVTSGKSRVEEAIKDI